MSQKINITGRPIKVSQEISDRYFKNAVAVGEIEKSNSAMELEETPSLIFHSDDTSYRTKYLVKHGGQPLCFLTQKEGSSDFTIGYVDGKVLNKETCREVRGFLKNRNL